MIGATILTAFNDNAAITYLASLVPGFSDALKYVVMAGAVTGGGANRNSQLAKSGRTIHPRVAIRRGRNFATAPFPRSPGTDADRWSSVYVAPLRGQLRKASRLLIESVNRHGLQATISRGVGIVHRLENQIS